MKSGDKTIIKCEIICPFCIESTGKWKLVKLVPKKYQIVFYKKTQKNVIWRHTHDVSNENEMLLWERKVLQEHLDKCKFKDYISSSVLEHYKLNR